LSGKSRLSFKLTEIDTLTIEKTIEYLKKHHDPSFNATSLQEIVAHKKLRPCFLYEGLLEHTFLHEYMGEQHDLSFLVNFVGYLTPIDRQLSI
jgi:hypothetical protein